MGEAERAEANAWLARSRDDLGAAAKLLSGDNPFPATAAYHCQQCAEKALKAVLASTGQAIPKTHDLRHLTQLALAAASSLDQLMEAAEQLTPFATEFRYPSAAPDPTMADVEEALELAEHFLVAVEQIIGAK